ncbi:conjugal transfer protein TraD [Qipengyuania sp. NPDC077563]|uniref:conjugal transfer protein TraD n=1 Tax=Qipengyuania sp. NPDC077563 TaxID=3364497 RepID=UPI00384E720C
MLYDPFPELLQELSSIHELGLSVLPVASEELAELKRQAEAAGKRRARDQHRYALGGLLVAVGLENVDFYALYGLLAHIDHLLVWSVEARSVMGMSSFAQIVEQILKDPIRAEGCSEWGKYLSWERMRALYAAEVTSFNQSKNASSHKRWRHGRITAKQHYLIAEICKIEGLPMPIITKKGAAFEWLKDKGGNPRFKDRPVPQALSIS